jgi:L-fuculose-phosphate aldolase
MVDATSDRFREGRHAVRETSVAMAAAGFATGSSGNISLRFEDRVLITASGVPYDRLADEQVIEIDMEGNALSGRGAPSSEWRMHVAVYRRRPDVRAIVHTHSPIATAAAAALSSLPILHDEGRILFGETIGVSAHQPPGTWELAHAVADALSGGRGVLIARHGVVAVGGTLDEAFQVAVKIEEIAHLYLLSRQFAQIARQEDPHETRR